jgi:hypothetical protein
MAFAYSGFQTVAQNYISRQIASNFYQKAVLLALLGALTLGNNKKTSLQIGRPNSAEILSGKYLSPAEKKNLQGINEYLPRLQAFKTSNTTARTGNGYVAAPTVANASTNAHSQAMQAAAAFRWTHLDTPILIWEEDEIRAGSKETKDGQGIAMSQIIDEATEVGMQDLIDTLNTQCNSGVPTDQNSMLWDSQSGLSEMFETANTYARTDRSVAGNSVWRGQKDTSLKVVDIAKIIDDANLAKKIRVNGNGVNCVLTTTDLYAQFKSQILSQGKGYGMVLDSGLPEFAAMGVKREVLQKDNAFIMYEPTVAANTLYAVDLTVFKFMVHPLFNFKVTQFERLWQNVEGGKWARQAYAQLRYMLTNDNPYLGCKYTAIGT